MAIGAHADDVELHFGGTLFKYQDKGYEIIYIMSTNNMSGAVRVPQEDGTWKKTVSFDPIRTIELRKRETAAAAKLFKTEAIHLDHPQRKCYVPDAEGNIRPIEVRYGTPLPPGVPAGVPTILTAFADPCSVERLKKLILERNPEVILTQGHAEVNPEHHATFLLTMRAYWKAVGEGYTGSLLFSARSFNELGRYACLWETWVDVTGYLDRKMESVLKHESQYPAKFAHGLKHWNEIAERKGRFCGTGAVEAYNFVNNDPKGTEETLLLNELIRNRAEAAPWGFSGDHPLAQDS